MCPMQYINVHTLPTALVLFINTTKVEVRLVCRTGGVGLGNSQRLLAALTLWSMDP